MNWAVVDLSTNIVVNVVIWDGVSDWAPPEGCIAIQSDVAAIGWIYNPNDGSLTPPEEQE